MAFGAIAGLVMLLAFGTNTERIVPPDVGSMAALGLAALLGGTLVVAGTRPLLASVSRMSPRD